MKEPTSEVCTKCGGTRKFYYHENGNLKRKEYRAASNCKHHWFEVK